MSVYSLFFFGWSKALILCWTKPTFSLQTFQKFCIWTAGGRLPVTWYPQEFTKVSMTDMRMRSDPASGYPGRTYRFYSGKPVYEFGYGLSYSSFSYKLNSTTKSIVFLKNQLSDLKPSNKEECDKLQFSAIVGVENHGPMDGRHSVLLFLRRPKDRGGRPRK